MSIQTARKYGIELACIIVLVFTIIIFNPDFGLDGLERLQARENFGLWSLFTE